MAAILAGMHMVGRGRGRAGHAEPSIHGRGRTVHQKIVDAYTPLLSSRDFTSLLLKRRFCFPPPIKSLVPTISTFPFLSRSNSHGPVTILIPRSDIYYSTWKYWGGMDFNC
jgi:hypothetical protein